MNKPTITIGLYRHFKGEYYFVQNLVRSAVDEKSIEAVYFNVLHPEYGTFVRAVSDFTADYDSKNEVYIKDRPDNVTGQTHRMERVVSLDNEVKNLSTEVLLEELRRRDDSPLHALDIDGFNDRVFCVDYIVGNRVFPSAEYPYKGVSYTTPPFDSEESAKKFFETHNHRRDTKVFKRTFIEVE